MKKTRKKEIKEKVAALTEVVHQLLEQTKDEEGRKIPSGSMRVVIDIPKAWIVLAAWLMLTYRARRDGTHRVADFLPVDEHKLWMMRPWAKLWMWDLIDSSMHAELHELCIGVHHYFRPPKPAPRHRPEFDLDDGIPF